MKKVLFSISVITLAAVITANAQQRTPLLEVFTSSTCGPCKTGNTNLKNKLASHADSTYVIIKYQQNFPGAGDPYATDESVNRRDYYNVTGIPNMQIDGGWDENAAAFTEADFTAATAVPAEYKLTGTYSITGKVVTATVNYNVLTTVPAGAKLYVAITEKKTVQNVKSNGETEFEDVMKKMMPNENGTAITEITANQSGSKTLTFTFNGNFRLPPNSQSANRINHATEHSVENFNNLQVIAWIQGTDKKVYQAANLKTGTTGINAVNSNLSGVSIYPNPASNVLNLNIDMVQGDNVTVNLYDMKGAVVSTTSSFLNMGTGKLSLDVSTVAAGSYTCVIFDSKNNSSAQVVNITH